MFIITGREVSFRVNDQVMTRSELEESAVEKSEADDGPIMPDKAEELVSQIYALAKRDIEPYKKNGDDDFSFAIKNVSRFRVNAFKQRGSYEHIPLRDLSFFLQEAENLLHYPA